MIHSSCWLGDEASLLTVLQATKYALDHPEKAAMYVECYDHNNPDEEEDEDESEFKSPLIQVFDSVGMVNVLGPMVAEDSWINHLFGLVSYPEISRAVIELVEAPGITDILMNYGSNGGDVEGLEEASDTLKWALKQKPVYSHNNNVMHSAAYWLGAISKSISTTKMAEMGSVGVLTVHRSVYRALQEQGIDYTVIRAGEFKALGHPSEKLSEKALKVLDDKTQQLYSFFLDHVSSYRPALSVATKSIWAEGKTFFGEESVALGLADKMESLSTVVGRLRTAAASRSSTTTFSSNSLSEVTDMAKPTKKVLLKDEASLAALESGAALESLSTAAAETSEEEAAAEATVQSADATTSTTTAAATAEPQSAQTGSELTAYLKQQNTELATQVASLTAKLEARTQEFEALKADTKGLTEIAVRAIHKMQIPLHSALSELEGMPTSTVIAQHAKVLKTFEETFKVGQQSRAFTGNEEDDAAPASPLKVGIVPKS